MKKTLALFLALCLMLSLCACGKDEPVETPAPVVTPAPAPTVEPLPTPTPEPTPNAEQIAELPEWIKLEDGIMTVELPVVEGDYAWDVSFSAAENAELVSSSSEEGPYVASFKGLAEGQCQITFSYKNGEHVAEERMVDVLTKEGQISMVLLCEVKTLDSVLDFALEPELLKLRSANSVSKILETKPSLICVSETLAVEDGEEIWQMMTVDRFSMLDGRLRHQLETYGTEAEPLSYSEYINGAYFSVVPGMYRSVNLFSGEEYPLYVEKQWLSRPEGGVEKTVSSKDGTEINTEVVYDFYGTRSEYQYLLDAEGLITGITQTDYLIETGEVLTVTRSNVIYDDSREMVAQGAAEISGDENFCLLSVTVNPGLEDEEYLEYSVAKDCGVSFMSMHGYELYADAECTQPIEGFDISGDTAQVYVMLYK